MIDLNQVIKQMRKIRPEVVFYFQLSCDSLVRYAPQGLMKKFSKRRGIRSKAVWGQ